MERRHDYALKERDEARADYHALSRDFERLTDQRNLLREGLEVIAAPSPEDYGWATEMARKVLQKSEGGKGAGDE